MRRWRWRRGIRTLRRENNKIVEKGKKIEEGNKIEKGEGYVKHCAQCKKKKDGLLSLTVYVYLSFSAK